MKWFLAPALLLLLTGCVQDVNAPSLARRPIESRDLNAAPPAAATAPVADAALAKQIADLEARAETGQRSFAGVLPRAQAAAGSAGSEGSEGWIAAQQLLSALDAARAETTAALAQLDELISKRVLGRDDAGLAELQAAVQRVGVLAEAQQTSLDQVRARISR